MAKLSSFVLPVLNSSTGAVEQQTFEVKELDQYTKLKTENAQTIGGTATSAYSEGDYFFGTDGFLYKATDSISVGGTITLNTNCEKTPIEDELETFVTSADIPTKISDLTNDSDFVESTDLATVATSGAYSDLSGTPSIPSKTSDITNDSGFITKVVNDLNNYYLKSELYTKTEIDTIVNNIKMGRFEVVNALPTEDIKTNVIYLVPKASATTNNAKDEYINLDGTTTGWELIGDTVIDLSGYVTDSELNTAFGALATVATSGSYNDLSNQPTIPTAVSDLTNDSGFVVDTDLATVATSGSYNDLEDQPTIPTDTSDLTNGAGFITSANIPTKTSDLTNDSGFVSSSSLATVATSGSYNDLSNQPTIPTAVSDLTNDSGFITSASLTELTDTSILSPSDLQVLVYDAIQEKWINGSLSLSLDELEDIGDVDLSNLQDGQTIVWDSTNSKWVNATTDYTAGSGINIANRVISSTTFIGTTAQWEALSSSQQAAYEIVNLTDDTEYVNNIVDIVQNNNMNAVTSNAVFDGLAEKVDKVAGKGLSTEDYTTAEKTKLSSIPEGVAANVQSDWEEDDTTSDAYIVNKPTLGTAAELDVPTSGDASTTEVVLGSDSRLTDAREASDVYSWAKASTKPTYTAVEVGAIATTDKGVSGGVAELDSNGKVPSSQLPSFVDDVKEGYLNTTDGKFYEESTYTTEITAEADKIYVDKSTNITYRWSGSAYVPIGSDLALGETSSTAYRGDRGKAAYDHATDSNKLSSAVTSGLYKVAATAEGHVASLTTVEKSDITALGIPGSDTTYESKTAASGGTDLSLVTTGEKYTWNNKQDTLIAGYGIDITNGVIASKTFVGTTAQWNALSSSQQSAYTYVNITDDNGPSDELGLSVVSGAICVTYDDSNS